ncbi:vWA domain-containing protein [Bacillus sp. B-jedd]|uniref:vWA domain-containing protein n=1 Tax=Bacillus sp. B-jedd TaxID=1476857 RepID=UPI0005156DA6|nr:VWA domain-containing protein [Bacillus sp. B-jedd]CEG25767.1 hypothetical protein BN1002_00584 [Bacillus sp. B-jedd]
MNKDLTEIIFLLDRSGSMAGLEQDTIGGYNSFLARQAGLDGETIVTTVLFDDKYEILGSGINAKKVKLTESEYFVRGTTALLDAVGKTIVDVGCRLAKTEEQQRPGKIVFVITTDGMENASREFTYEKVQNLIRHQQEKYSWEFIFMGANIDAAEEAGNLGIDEKHAYSFEASSLGVERMYEMATEAVSKARNRK